MLESMSTISCWRVPNITRIAGRKVFGLFKLTKSLSYYTHVVFSVSSGNCTLNYCQVLFQASF